MLASAVTVSAKLISPVADFQHPHAHGHGSRFRSAEEAAELGRFLVLPIFRDGSGEDVIDAL